MTSYGHGEDVVDYEEEEDDPGIGLEDGEVQGSQWIAGETTMRRRPFRDDTTQQQQPGARYRDPQVERPPLSHEEAARLAKNHDVGIDVVYAAYERRHDLNGESLEWMALSLELDIERGIKEKFPAWKERIAKTAHRVGKAHPWEKLPRFRNIKKGGAAATR